MRALRFAGALVAVVLLHVLGAHLFQSFPPLVDLFLVLTVFNALGGDAFSGMMGGLVAGLVADAFAGGGLYGLFGFADTVIGYGVAMAAQRLVVHRLSGMLLVFWAAAFAQQLLVFGLLWFLLQSVDMQIFWALLKVPVTGLVGLVAVWGSRQTERSYEAWRRARTASLRMK